MYPPARELLDDEMSLLEGWYSGWAFKEGQNSKRVQDGGKEIEEYFQIEENQVMLLITVAVIVILSSSSNGNSGNIK